MWKKLQLQNYNAHFEASHFRNAKKTVKFSLPGVSIQTENENEMEIVATMTLNGIKFSYLYCTFYEPWSYL